ncbi:MAG: hypothetical protein H3C35_00570 [Bacteroidetes bacterium]|nr:hypothetical protein [Bacteroidota bacterium]
MKSNFCSLLLAAGISFFLLSCNEVTTGPQSGTGTAPPAFYLNQNYPNPFTDTTTIEYGVPSSGGSSSLVSVIVYNQFQERIQNLVYNTSHTAGSFKTKWFGDDTRGNKVPPGIYIIELKGYSPQAVVLRITAIKK